MHAFTVSHSFIIVEAIMNTRSKRTARTRTSQKSASNLLVMPVPRAARNHYPVPWRTFIAQNANEIVNMQRSALGLLVESGDTVMSVLQYLFSPLFGEMARKETIERGKENAKAKSTTGRAKAA